MNGPYICYLCHTVHNKAQLTYYTRNGSLYLYLVLLVYHSLPLRPGELVESWLLLPGYLDGGWSTRNRGNRDWKTSGVCVWLLVHWVHHWSSACVLLQHAVSCSGCPDQPLVLPRDSGHGGLPLVWQEQDLQQGEYKWNKDRLHACSLLSYVCLPVLLCLVF